MTDGAEQVDSIASKPLNRFGQDQIDLPLIRSFHHRLKANTLLCSCSTDAVIRIDASELPFRMRLDHPGEIANLQGIGAFLLFAEGGDPAIGCHFFLFQKHYGLLSKFCNHRILLVCIHHSKGENYPATK